MGQRKAGARGKVTKEVGDLIRVVFNDGKEPPIRWLFWDEVTLIHDVAVMLNK